MLTGYWILSIIAEGGICYLSVFKGVCEWKFQVKAVSLVILATSFIPATGWDE